VAFTISRAGPKCNTPMENLVEAREYEINIYFADGGFVKSELIGQYKGYMKGYEVLLNDVLYIPTFKRNLLSIDHLTEDYYKIVFYKNRLNEQKCATIYNSDNKRIYTSISNGSNVYKVLTSINYINANSCEVVCYSLDKSMENNNLILWHRRLGHTNIDPLKEKLKKLNID